MAISQITANSIADGTVVASDIADGTITDAKIVGVANTKITGLVTASQIANVANTQVTGTITIAQGGTGSQTLTANNVIIGNGASAVAFVAPGTIGNVLTSSGTTWTSVAAAAGGTTIPSGTRMLFQQTAAPTGFTKDTTAAINDSMLRLVTGSASSGGTTAFSTWSAVTATGAHTLDTTQIPSHSHNVDRATGEGANIVGFQKGVGSGQSEPIATSSTGGGSSHTHSLTRNLKYYDFIIAAKD